MNLFPKQKTPYYIWSPPYTHTSSGVITLHLLCHALNEMGEKAYIVPNSYTGFVLNPVLNTPLLSIQHQNFYGDDFIAVYSDVVRGNPFNAKHVVRMLLAPRGTYGGDTVFPETEQIWGALPTLADNVLRIPVTDTNIFYPNFGETRYGYFNVTREEILTDVLKASDKLLDSSGGIIRIKRSGSCFYSRKYELHGNQPLMDITGSSTRLVGAPEQLAHILRKSEVCYLYELTGVITEAALCGCPVTLVRTPYFNTIDPACMMGDVRWDDGEIVKKCPDYLLEYQKFIDDFPKQLENFIEKTRKIL